MSDLNDELGLPEGEVVSEPVEGGSKAVSADDYEVQYGQEDFNNLLFPKGRCRFRIDKAYVRKSSKGFDMINWRFVSVQEPTIGRSTFVMTSLAPSGIFTLNNLCKALGYKPIKGWKPSELYGMEVEALVEHALVEGVLRERVNQFFPVKL
jgi:hypothetical protein